MGDMNTAHDFQLSPFTGWTRTHWEALADRMLLSVRPYADDSHALISLPGPASVSGAWSDGLEGFARTFLLAVFRLAGAAGRDPLGLAEWYAAGLTAGTDPASPSRWPRMDEIEQAKVEAASIAIGLHETRPWLWDRLAPDVQARVLDWLSGLAGAHIWPNNWVWFRAVVAAFARSAGADWDPADMAWAIEHTDEWYAGDGWYSDGCYAPGDFRCFDHYNGWAMHLYPLWFCRIADAGTDLSGRYRARLHRFLEDAEHLVGADGAPLFQGRSLTYRFAAAVPFWAGALFDATPLSPGLTRRIASGMVRYFTDAGCLRADGTLSIGWHGEYLPIRQAYSGPGSPYWAAKAFAGLLLPASHPAWTATEQPLAVERGDFTRSLAAPGWLVSGTRADGLVRVVNHGTDHYWPGTPDWGSAPCYTRVAYATRTAPAARSELDGTAALAGPAGLISRRKPLHLLEFSRTTALSRHQALFGDDEDERAPWLTVASVLRGCWEVRAVRVDQDVADPELRVHIGGWVIADTAPPVERLTAHGASLSRADGLRADIVALHGPLTAAVSALAPEPGADVAHPFGRYASVGYLRSAAPVRAGELYVAAIALTADPAGPGEPPSLDIPADGEGPAVRWPDDRVDPLPR